jgi:uncharacterized protein (TIGR03435 family)
MLATGASVLALSQSPSNDPARFKVASIRPAVPQKVSGCIGTMCGGPRTNDPEFRYLDVPLVSVLVWAYGKTNFQIFGGPSWLTSPFDSPKFDIVARVPPRMVKELDLFESNHGCGRLSREPPGLEL